MIKKNKAYKFRLYPNKEQQIYFAKCFGCVRFLYNQMLGERKALYAQYKDDKEMLRQHKPKSYTAYKKDYDWLYEIDSLALANAQMNLQTAFNNFFRNTKIGFPKFKSKKSDKNSYTTNNQNNFICFDSGKIKLPKIGWVKVKQHRRIPETQRIKSVTISQTSSGKYFVSILVEWWEDIIIPEVNISKSIGLDYSSPHFYVDSNNNQGNYPKFYRNAQTKLAKEQRKLSKCKCGSKNYNKQRINLACAHEKVANCRKDWLEKLSYSIAKNNDIVCIENLNMRAMSKSLHLGKSTMDNGWGMFVNMLQRKVKKVIKVDKWFPSSKLCPKCGTINTKLTLKDRIWICECGNIIDRDYNAANNILIEGLSQL